MDPTENAIQNQLGGNNPIKGGYDPQKIASDVGGMNIAVGYKQTDEGVTGQLIDKREDQGHSPGQPQAAARSVPNSFGKAGAGVLSSKIGHAGGKGGDRGNGHVVKLYGRRISADGGGPEGIDQALNNYISDRYEALLQYAGNCHGGKLLQNGKGKNLESIFAWQLVESAQDRQKCQHGADALADQGSPGYPGDPKLQGLYKINIHQNIGDRGEG